MEKFVKKKKLFMGLMVLLLLLGCGNNANSQNNGNLIIKKKDYSFKKDLYSDIPYMNYDEVFDIKGTQKATGKYSNTTPDGKINWDVKEDVQYEQTPIAKEMAKKATLDGKPINLPMKFKDLGDDFAEFDNIDFSKFNKKDKSITITNKKNGYLLHIITIIGEGNERLDLYNQKNQPLYNIYMDVKNKNIIGISSGFGEIGIKDIRVDGIGNGNTFNEMYAKFGKPYDIDEMKFSTIVTYYFEDKNDKKSYIIRFTHEKILENKNTKKEEKTKPNVIASVNVTVMNKNK